MTEVLQYAAGVLLFAVVIVLSIALHEVGHLVPAKRFGVKVTKYMVGFGPTMWSRRKGETEYGVKWLPFGGYIRMIGMFPPRPGDDPGTVRESSTGAFQTMADDARKLSAAEVGPGDVDRVFYKLSVPKKVVVMLGGPVMNLLIGTVLLGALVLTVGNPTESVTTTTISVVNKCVAPADAQRTECLPTDPIAPASEAGIKPGDEIVSFNGQAVTSWDQVREAIRTSAGEETSLVVRRDGEEVPLTVTPRLTEVPMVREGELVTTADGTPRYEEVGFLGVSPVIEMAPGSIADVPVVVGDAVVRTAGVVVQLPQRMVDVAQAAFGQGERDPNGPIGIVGVGRLTGEVASIDSFTAQDRLAGMLSVLGGLNIALFVFNLIPLLPLDGGHVAGALWEGTRRTVARVRGRADPGPVDVARALPIAYGVAIALIGMSALLLYADIVRPVTLRG
jgi:membrane-associated protease RseP (regulator of RpoE activity)